MLTELQLKHLKTTTITCTKLSAIRESTLHHKLQVGSVWKNAFMMTPKHIRQHLNGWSAVVLFSRATWQVTKKATYPGEDVRKQCAKWWGIVWKPYPQPPTYLCNFIVEQLPILTQQFAETSSLPMLWPYCWYLLTFILSLLYVRYSLRICIVFILTHCSMMDSIHFSLSWSCVKSVHCVNILHEAQSGSSIIHYMLVLLLQLIIIALPTGVTWVSLMVSLNLLH